MNQLITKIKLRNWRSHEDTELEFDRGINVIMGRMGSGKSSITDAICFALFATFPTLQKKSIKLDDVIMRYPKEKKNASVELWFEIDGKKYYVKRIVEKKKGTTTSEIRENERLVEGPKSNAVTKLIEKILGIDYELFTRAVYSEQNNIDYFLSLRPSDRKKKIDELLMIDKFEELRSSAVSVINKTRERMKNRLADIENINEKKLSGNKLDIEKEIKLLKNEIKKNETEEQEVQKSIGATRMILENMEKKKDALDSLNNKLSAKLGEISSIESNIKDLEDKTRGQKLDGVQNKLSELENERDQISNSISESDKKNDSLTKNLSEISGKLGKLKSEKELIEKNIKERKIYEQKLKEYESKYKNLENLSNIIGNERNKIESLQLEIGSIKSRIKISEESVEKLSMPGNKCPVCGSILKEEKKKSIIKEKLSLIKDLKEQNKKTEESINKSKELIDNLSRIKIVWEKILSKIETIKDVDKERIDNEISSLNEKKKVIENDIIKLKSEMSENESKYKSLLNDISKFKNLKESIEKLYSIKKEREKIKEEIKSIKNKIKLIDFNKNNYGKEKEKLIELSSREGNIKMSIQKNNEIMIEKNKTLKEIENQIKLLEGYKRDYKILKIMDQQLPKFKDAIEKTQVQLRNELISLVNSNMSSIWKEFYPYEEYEDIRLNTLDNDYKLELFNGNEWIPVEGMTSGGERTTAAITLRISLSVSLVKQLKWLILDEPTHNLDEVAIESFSFILREKLSSMVNQIFIITHEEKLENAVTGTFYRLKKEGGITKEFKEEVE